MLTRISSFLSLFSSKTQRSKRSLILSPAQSSGSSSLQIKGFRVEHADKEPKHGDDNVPELQQGTNAVLRLFGSGFTEQTTITFTEERHTFGGPCQMAKTDPFHVIKESVTPNGDSVLVQIRVPKTTEHFYFCARQAENDTAGLVRGNRT